MNRSMLSTCLVTVALLLTLITVASRALAQEAPALAERVTNAPPPSVASGLPAEGAVATETQDGKKVYYTYKTPFEFYLTLLTIVLAIGMVAALLIMGWRAGITEEFLRSFMIVVIVFAALFLVVAGYSDEQTAPVFGLLGTIAGYIFGRMQRT